MNEITNKPGIYAIKNTINGRIYIGSSIGLRDRKSGHFRWLRLGEHCNPFLQADYNKHGGDKVYEFVVLETVEDINLLIEREQHYIDRYFDNQDRCFNICPTAGSNLGYKMSEETKRKISIALKGQIIHPNTLARLLDKERNPFSRAGIEHPKSGKAMSESAREAIRKALTGKIKTEEHCRNLGLSHLGKPLSDEHKAVLSDGRRKGTNNAHAKKVIQLDLQGNVIKIWDLMSEAARETNTILSRISRCCHGHNKAANGFVWRLVESDKIDLEDYQP